MQHTNESKKVLSHLLMLDRKGVIQLLGNALTDTDVILDQIQLVLNDYHKNDKMRQTFKVIAEANNEL